MAGVVGRVDVDHLHLAQIGLLEQLEHLQVVALNVQVFGGVPVLALLWTGAQGLADGLVSLHDGGFLAHPGELVGLVPLQHIVGQHLLKQLKVDGLFQPALAVRALRDAPGEQGGDLLYILRRQIRRLKFHVVHQAVPPLLFRFLKAVRIVSNSSGLSCNSLSFPCRNCNAKSENLCTLPLLEVVISR